ncbi:MAG TPA: hypothetical protein VGT03_01300 [Candidatus Acidoferrales bacterium]|nr:hypothetical protein [Candidatus Acidoferrales bacterium]
MTRLLRSARKQRHSEPIRLGLSRSCTKPNTASGSTEWKTSKAITGSSRASLVT